jgi:DNA-binding GntR family transcriptional regulator
MLFTLARVFRVFKVVTLLTVTKWWLADQLGNDDHMNQPHRPEERPSVTVERDLRRRIASGEWRSGDQLPNTNELAGHYGVAPGTVQRVMRKLAEDGLVRVVVRWGTFKT